jgi:hypothetical protein
LALREIHSQIGFTQSGVIIALEDMPLAFLHNTWNQARDAASSHLMHFLFETRAPSNTTVDPAVTASVTPQSFFDPSSVYTSGYALGVAFMVRL